MQLRSHQLFQLFFLFNGIVIAGVPKFRQALIFLLAVSVSLFSLQAAAELPQDFSATYKAKYRGISITAKRSLAQLDNGRQLFTFSADSFIADLKETSEFQWNENDHIIPVRYTYERGGLGRDRKAELKFDWQQKKVENNVQNKPWTMPVPDLALDKLSYQLQLRTDLINGKDLSGYEIADGGKLKVYSFKIIGEEELKTPAGRFDVVKVKRVREQDDERQTIIWFAKNWNYMVVRLQQEEDDKSYEIDLVSATLNGKKVKGGE